MDEFGWLVGTHHWWFARAKPVETQQRRERPTVAPSSSFWPRMIGPQISPFHQRQTHIVRHNLCHIYVTNISIICIYLHLCIIRYITILFGLCCTHVISRLYVHVQICTHQYIYHTDMGTYTHIYMHLHRWCMSRWTVILAHSQPVQLKNVSRCTIH